MKNILTKRNVLIVLLIVSLLATMIITIDYIGIGQTNTSSKNTNTTPQATGYNIVKVVGGLNTPWAIAFTSPARMLVTERNGAIRVVENGKLAPRAIANLSVSTGGEEGLMGIATDPNYTQNKYVYVCLAYDSGAELKVKVLRFTDQGNSIRDQREIIAGIPAAQFHAGCRIKFGPDSKLYITTGDATDRTIAQDVANLGGKILRINADGSIPTDNPFSNSPVYSYGHRNPQGIAWQPTTNNLYETEHGPSGFDGAGGGDEINLITIGSNYGWPVVSHQKTSPQFASPLLVFTPAVAPAGMAFLASSKIPSLQNNMFFGALRGEALYSVVFSSNNPNEIDSYEKLPDVSVGRIREVIEGPDGLLYFASSNLDGRGTINANEDIIYRLEPKK